MVTVWTKDENKVYNFSAHKFIWNCIKDQIPEGYKIDHINSNRGIIESKIFNF